MTENKCPTCGKLIKKDSLACKKHRLITVETRIKRGISISIANKGRKLSEQWKLNITLALPRGDKHPGWKGNKVSYGALHVWLKRIKGKPRYCVHCGDFSDRKYHWANIDHAYSRDPNDYISLCVPCHRKYDGDFKLTDEQVGYIKDRLSFGEKQKDLAKEFGVDPSIISRIKNHKRL